MTNSIERALLRNPDRVPGQFTEQELEYKKVLADEHFQTPTVYGEKTYEYRHPFKYPNVRVELGPGGEFNMDGAELDIPPRGAITIEQDEPIIAVTVIGSACVPPGYVILHAEPLVWEYPRTGIKMKVKDLWGEHLRWNVWARGVDEGWHQAGISCARFDLPDSHKVTLMGGSETDVGNWLDKDGQVADTQHDAHYCFRIIRVTVRDSRRVLQASRGVTAVGGSRMKRSIVYFDQIGKQNTGETLRLAHQRATELGVKNVVVASNTGFTARHALTEFEGSGIALTVVGGGRKEFDGELAQELQSRGHQVLFAAELQYTYPGVVANAFKKLCEGLKVIMEITSIAVDAGIVAEGEEIVAIAGTGRWAFPPGGGADTAVVVTPGPSSEHGPDYALPMKPERRRVREILCMPR